MGLLSFVLLLLLYACSTSKKAVQTLPAAAADSLITTVAAQIKTDTFLENMLMAKPLYFSQVLQNRAALKVQVIYTQINRKPNNEPVFTPYYFNVDSAAYFYPASTVKLPIALLALQAGHELSLPGLDKKQFTHQ